MQHQAGKEYNTIYSELESAEAERQTDSHGGLNRFKSRAALEGGNFDEALMGQRDAMLKLFDDVVYPPVKNEMGDYNSEIDAATGYVAKPLLNLGHFRLDRTADVQDHHNSQSIAVLKLVRLLSDLITEATNRAETYYSERERILWALIGELSLALSKVNGDREAAAIQKDQLAQLYPVQTEIAEHRKFMADHFPRITQEAEVRGISMIKAAQELLLDRKG